MTSDTPQTDPNAITDTLRQQGEAPVPQQLGVPPLPDAPTVPRRVPTYEEIQRDLQKRGVDTSSRQTVVEQNAVNPYSLTITLGGVEYTIPKLVSKRSKEWRGKMRAPLDEILSVMNGTMSFEIDNVQDLVVLIRGVQDTLLAAPDTIIDLVFDYSYELQSKREFIMEHAYDDQFFTAFIALAKAAFPLDQLMQFLGRSKATIPSNSQELNGESQKTT